MVVANLKSFFIGLGILAVGVLGLVVLVALRPEPPKVERPTVSPIVATAQPEVRQGRLTVTGNGTVRPTREINLVAEVAGKTLWTADALRAGGFFRSGQALVRLDPTDYENAVAMAEAEVAQREYELLLMQEEADLAREEWGRAQRFTGLETPPETALGSLALKEPQLQLAEALLKSARARLADARTRLERTTLTAPFNGRVRTKGVDVGQYVGPGQLVATLYSTDAVEIAVPLRTADAALIEDLWTQEARGQRVRIPAQVAADFGGQRYTWNGHVERTEGTLDPGTRTVNVVVRVDAPYQTHRAGQPPLMVGMFTQVEIDGKAVGTYHAIPREALREGDTVWVVTGERLAYRPVTVLQETDGLVFVTGLQGDEQLVTSNLTVVTDGMAVRIAG